MIGYIIGALIVLNVVFLLLLLRLSRRLLQFDNLFEMLVEDIDTNVKYFDSISEHPLLSNTQEIQDADNNMRIMRQRLNEYVLRMEELTRRQLRKRHAPRRPPVVV